MNEFIMHRYPANLLIKPEDFPVPADSVMNCGQAMYKDKTVLLVAAIYRGLVNVKRTGIHIEMSDNRINFQIDPNPLCSGTDFGGDDRFYDRWVIDPHITQIGDEYYICCPGQGTIGPCELLEKSTDFKAAEFLGAEIKDTWLFEDSLTAIETATKIGMPTVGIYDKFNYGQKAPATFLRVLLSTLVAL